MQCVEVRIRIGTGFKTILSKETYTNNVADKQNTVDGLDKTISDTRQSEK